MRVIVLAACLWSSVLSGGVATIQKQSDLPPARPAPVAWDRVLDQPAGWYAGAEAARIADTVRLYQRQTGGWPKNLDMAAPLSDAQRTRLIQDQRLTDSTIDNGATTTQIRFLARVGGDANRTAAVRGIDFLLAAQYDNGGWPQYFPLRSDYSRRITFNDDAMVRVMTLLDDVAKAEAPFAFIDTARRARIANAVARGVSMILRTQIRVAGAPAGWGQQYDERTLEPAGARSYEHRSLASSETVGIVRFLMTRVKPEPPVIAAVEGAVAWLQRARLPGLRLERRTDASVAGGADVVVVEDPSAPGLWARFYDIDTGAPIFSGRDGVIKRQLSEIEVERRTGYSWLGTYAQSLIAREFPAWRAAIQSGRGPYNWTDQL